MEQNYKLLSLLVSLFLVFSLKIEASLTYSLEFQGVYSQELDSALKASSQLMNLSEHTVDSLGVLKRRSEADVVNFVKVLHWLAYYNAKVSYKIDNTQTPIKIIFTIETGPIYPLANFTIKSTESKSNEKQTFNFENICLEDIGITLGTPAYIEVILQAEEAILNRLAQSGYPQAEIKKRRVIADQTTKTITVDLEVDSGILAYFGSTTVTGNPTVREGFFYKKIAWCEGEPYNLDAIQKTQEALERSALFTSMVITKGKVDPETGELPIEIQVMEAKHRSIAGGVSYTTARGVGGLMEWSHRNFRGRGERVNIHANIWKETQDGKFSYVLPDFLKKNQDLIWLIEVEHEITDGYTETSFSTSAIFDNKINRRLRLSYGGMFKWILDEHTDNNGNFFLLKAPLQLRWNTAEDLLDPKSGYSVNLKAVPTVQVKAPVFFYAPLTFTGTVYLPLVEDARLLLAGKAIIGSIVGTSRHIIPPSERFYAGSENTLRGYKYMTVAPLSREDKPLGGRSMMIFSTELRLRLSDKFGVVAFYEVGNVYESWIPQINHEQLQSLGAGVRYHTAVGPIRFDLAFPLNRRNKRKKDEKNKKFDGPYEVYMSIGQSF